MCRVLILEQYLSVARKCDSELLLISATKSIMAKFLYGLGLEKVIITKRLIEQVLTIFN